MVPLVCQRFRRIHNDHPPVRLEWSLHTPVERSEVDWLCRAAPSLVKLSVNVGTELGDLPRLLASLTAPKLELLSLEEWWAGWPVLDSLRRFSQIKRLELDHFHFPEQGDAT